MSKTLYEVAEKLGDPAMLERTKSLVQEEVAAIMPEIPIIARN